MKKKNENSNSVQENIIKKKPKRPLMRFLGNLFIPMSIFLICMSGIYFLLLYDSYKDLENSYYSDISENDWTTIYEGMKKTGEEESKAIELQNNYYNNRNPQRMNNRTYTVIVDPFEYSTYTEYEKVSKQKIKEDFDNNSIYKIFPIQFDMFGILFLISGIICKRVYNVEQKV